jgi:hypothetical protein
MPGAALQQRPSGRGFSSAFMEGNTCRLTSDGDLTSRRGRNDGFKAHKFVAALEHYDVSFYRAPRNCNLPRREGAMRSLITLALGAEMARPRNKSCRRPGSLIGSEFQAGGEVESIALDGVADVEVMDPTGVKVEVTLTQLRRVRNNGANAEGTANKTVESVR